LGEGARVIVHRPVVEYEGNHHRVKLELSAIIRERNDEYPHEKNEMNKEYYVHLL